MGIAIYESLSGYKDRIFPIILAISAAGGKAYLVGGCVRDMVLNLPLKDLDIEVHGLALQDLQEILQQFGFVEEVGKKFGVLLLLGLAVDWSLPREDSSGRKPTVILQPHLNLTQALRRRDLTMNAMAIDLNDIVIHEKECIDLSEIVDPFGGISDLKKKQLCAVDDVFFTQDPLRLLRVMQFIGRFDMQPSESLTDLCKKMVLYDTYDNRPLARERIHAEVAKLLLQSPRPSLGFEWIIKIQKAAEIFPFLVNYENALWALKLVDDMARATNEFENFERLALSFAALCFPCWSKNTGSSIRSLLEMSTGSTDLIETVTAVLIAVQGLGYVQNNDLGVLACKRIAATLKSKISLRVVARLATALYEPNCSIFEEAILFSIIQKAGVLDCAEEPLVFGRDLLRFIEPGPKIGKALALGYKIQLEEGIKDKDELLERILDGIEKK